MQEAYYAYARWGATAKITYLEQQYPQLLAAILQPETRLPSTKSTLIDHSSKRSTKILRRPNMLLDFPVIMKAAQAISQEIELERLVATLMQIAVANAGAQRGNLVLLQAEKWVVVAYSERSHTQPLTIPLDEYKGLPQQLLHWCIRTQESAIFDHLGKELQYTGDPYVNSHQPRSVLCLPLCQQGQTIGVLYLENNTMVGAFTPARLEVLHLLTSQAAIAITNACLYQQVERYSQQLEREVDRKTRSLSQKTQDLEQVLAALQQSNQDLVRMTQLKDEFLANMSHELRTPLNAILGMAEALQEDGVFGQLNTRQMNAIQIIERSGSHLLELINDILDLSKIEAGELALDITSISVPTLCSASLAFVRQQALKKQIQLTLNPPPDTPDLLGDERRIRQVLINLLTNAVKFTPKGGKVTVTVESYPNPALDNQMQNTQVDSEYDIQEAIAPKILSIAVTDTGIGIAPDNMSKLFQPFVQIDSALNRQYEGTGLGLSLVQRIVEMHGGQVDVSSDVGVGSCFKITLPCWDTQSSSVVPQTQRAVSPNQTTEESTIAPLILLAEDNKANIKTVSSYLQAKGYRLTLAHNGQEAIAALHIERPDLILMDIQMPKMDGLTAIKHIRQNPDWQDIPIIALTALAMEGDRDRCLAAGANEYLSKPVKLKTLTQRIRTLLTDDSP